MSKDDDKEGGEKKSKKGLIIGIAVGVVVLVAGAVAGVLFIPKMLGGPETAEATEHKEGGGEKEKKKESEVPEKIVAGKFDPIIVDLRDSEGAVRHLKVGLSAELDETMPEEEFKLLQPRGREAAIAYLRTLTFDKATDPKRYPKVKKDLSKKVLQALGKEHIKRLLITDFVAQ